MISLQQLLSQAGISVREQGTNVGRDFINICCPFCKEERFHCGIHETDYWFKCFVCGEGGKWDKLAARLTILYKGVNWNSLTNGTTNFLDIQKTETTKTKRILTDYCREVSDKDTKILEWLETPPALEFINEKDRERGLDIGIAMDAGLHIGVGKLNGYIVFKEGNNINARKYNDGVTGSRWWKFLEDKPYLFGANFAPFIQPHRAVITEGIFDCLRFPLGTAVAILGSVVSNEIVGKIASTFKNSKEILLAFDRDANNKAVVKMELMLRDLGFVTKVFDWSEINNLKIKDMDELYIYEGKERFNQRLNIENVAITLR